MTLLPRLLLPAVLCCALAPQLSAVTIFSEDFSGIKNWNFDAIVDPEGQIGGTGQMTYTIGETNENSYLTRNITMSDFTSEETGVLVITGTMDLRNITFGTADHNKRNILTIGASAGNKNSFVPNSGSVMNLGLSGRNDPGENSLGQGLAVRFWSGGNANIASFSADIYTLTTTLDISGDDAIGWTVEATTEIENSLGAVQSMNSEFFRVDSGFNGLQSINRVMIGFKPTASSPADSPENLGEGVFMWDDLSMTLVPEPSAASLLFAGLGAFLLLRRRRGTS